MNRITYKLSITVVLGQGVSFLFHIPFRLLKLFVLYNSAVQTHIQYIYNFVNFNLQMMQIDYKFSRLDKIFFWCFTWVSPHLLAEPDPAVGHPPPGGSGRLRRGQPHLSSGRVS